MGFMKSGVPYTSLSHLRIRHAEHCYKNNVLICFFVKILPLLFILIDDGNSDSLVYLSILY